MQKESKHEIKYDILHFDYILTTLHKLHTWPYNMLPIRLVCAGGKPLSFDP